MESEHQNKEELRSQIREQALAGSSVEFMPAEDTITYHFKLKDFSSNGFGILVRKDSQVLKHIKSGDVLSMKFHPDEATANPVPHQTQIRHISEPEPGKHKGHMLVGLMILE